MEHIIIIWGKTKDNKYTIIAREKIIDEDIEEIGLMKYKQNHSGILREDIYEYSASLDETKI